MMVRTPEAYSADVSLFGTMKLCKPFFLHRSSALSMKRQKISQLPRAAL